MRQYRSQIKRALNGAKLAWSKTGEEVTASVPFLAILARKTNRPPQVIGNATLLAVISILLLSPSGVASILSDLLIFFPLFTISLKTLLFGPTQRTVQPYQWQGLVEFWVIFSGITLLKSTIGQETLSSIFPIYYTLKVVSCGWLYLSCTRTPPLKAKPKPKPNPLHLAVSNISITQPSIHSVKGDPRLQMRPSDPTEDSLSTAEPPSSSDGTNSSTSEISPSSGHKGAINSTRALAKSSEYSTSRSDESPHDDSGISASSAEQVHSHLAEIQRAPMPATPRSKGKIAEDDLIPTFVTPKDSTESSSPDPSPGELSSRRPKDSVEVSTPESNGDGAFDLDDLPILADNLSLRTSSLGFPEKHEKEERRIYSMTLDELLLLEGQEDSGNEVELPHNPVQAHSILD